MVEPSKATSALACTVTTMKEAISTNRSFTTVNFPFTIRTDVIGWFQVF